MAKVRYNGKIVNFEKNREYSVRKHTKRLQRANRDGKLLNTVMQQLSNRQRKQNNRWLRTKVEGKNRSGITLPVERELVDWFRASPKEQEKPKLRPNLQLSADAMQVWRGLKAERKAAMEAQGQKFEAEDWWTVAGTGQTKKKPRSKEHMEELTTTMAGLGIEGLEFVAEDEEGKFVVLSHGGSVVGEQDEEKEEEGSKEEGGVAGFTQLLPFRGLK